MKLVRRSSLLLIALVTASWMGCGKGRVPVEGVVTMNGKPLAGATVTLLGSEGSSQERTFVAETDADGRYQIKTANGSSAGAPPGEYSVFVTSVKIPSDVMETTKIPRDLVPPRWRDGSQKLSVPAEGNTDANFVIATK